MISVRTTRPARIVSCLLLILSITRLTEYSAIVRSAGKTGGTDRQKRLYRKGKDSYEKHKSAVADLSACFSVLLPEAGGISGTDGRCVRENGYHNGYYRGNCGVPSYHRDSGSPSDGGFP